MRVYNSNYFTTDIAIILVIHRFSMILFKSHLLRKLFYIINSVGLIYILITCNCISKYNQVAINSEQR